MKRRALAERQGLALAALMLFVGCGATAALAIDADSRLRYDMQADKDGFVRLDRQTGEMSFCQVRDGDLICRMGADERAAYEKALADMQARLEALESGEQGGDGVASSKRQERIPESGNSPQTPGLGEQEEREFEKAMEFAQRAMRRFYDALKDLKSDIERERDAQ